MQVIIDEAHLMNGRNLVKYKFDYEYSSSMYDIERLIEDLDSLIESNMFTSKFIDGFIDGMNDIALDYGFSSYQELVASFD